MPATANRNTPERAGLRRGYPVGADVECFAGAIAVLNASGHCVPATEASGLTAVGRFAHYLDNRGGGAADHVVEVERGIFRYHNSAGGDEIEPEHVGQVCYLVDDVTVALTDDDGGRSPAGVIDGVDDAGVWVSIDPLQAPALA